MYKDFYHTGLQVGRTDLRNILGNMGPGNHWYVDYRNGSDGKHGSDGRSWQSAFKTVGAAVDAAISNNNDFIHIDGDSQVIELSMLSISKNRLHFIGHNGMPGHMGQGARIACTATTGATNIATAQNTGVRNTFTGIKFESAMTIAESLYGFVEAGEFTRFFNCSFYKSSDLNDNGAAEIALNGDTAMFYGCTVGSTVNETGGIRPNVILTGGIVSGKKCRDSMFENCIFLAKADDTDKVFIYGANATDVERLLYFKDCLFYNTKLASGVPAHAVGFGAAQTEGSVILKNCTSVNCTIMAEAAVGIYVDGAVPTFATTGVSVAS